MGGKGSGPQTGILHTSEKRIRILLRNPCISYAEIGRRLGVTRERIRQVHDGLFVEEVNTGRVRQHVCAVTKPKHPLPKNCLAFRLKEKCECLGFNFQPVYCRGSLARQRIPIPNEGIVNGHLCRLQTARLVRGYISISRWRVKKFAFCLSWFIDDGRWIIRPPDRFERTMFVEKAFTEKPGAYSDRHDWPEYIEAWHLLKKSP